MPFEAYIVIHLIGVIMVFMAFGALVFHQLSHPKEILPHRRLIMMTHGFGLLIVLVGGFGLLHKLGLEGSWPLWVWLKITIWIILGGGVAFVLRKPRFAMLNWYLLMVLFACAALLAKFH